MQKLCDTLDMLMMMEVHIILRLPKEVDILVYVNEACLVEDFSNESQ